MFKILIATPTYDGKLESEYVKSLMGSVDLMKKYNIIPEVQFFPYCSLISHVRNAIFKEAYEGGFDDLLFIDADQSWKPDDVMRILNHDVDVCGGMYPKKRDDIQFNTSALPEGVRFEPNGLIEVLATGTGFLRFSKRAINMLWNQAMPYVDGDQEYRAVCNITIERGYLMGEDYDVCFTWREMGEKVYCDPEINLGHIGSKHYKAIFKEHLMAVRPSEVGNDNAKAD